MLSCGTSTSRLSASLRLVSFRPGLNPLPSQIFRAIHNAYISHIASPFTSAETDNPAALSAPIRSRKFAKAMDDVAGGPPPKDDGEEAQ
jgi:hypothetical protein